MAPFVFPTVEAMGERSAWHPGYWIHPHLVFTWIRTVKNINMGKTQPLLPNNSVYLEKDDMVPNNHDKVHHQMNSVRKKGEKHVLWNCGRGNKDSKGRGGKDKDEGRCSGDTRSRSRGFQSGPGLHQPPEMVCQKASWCRLKSGGCPRKANLTKSGHGGLWCPVRQ